MTIISLILAVFKAIPILETWYVRFSEAYVEWAYENQNKQLRSALEKMFSQHDQRDLEKAIGSDNAGKPALNQDGVETRPRR